jgi:hypothetical protein
MWGMSGLRSDTPVRSWILSTLLGAVAPLFMSLGLVLGLLGVGGIAILAIRRAGLLGLSGALTGFGLFWTILIARVLMQPGALDNGFLWLMVGLVPLATGLALAVVMQSRRFPCGEHAR